MTLILLIVVLTIPIPPVVVADSTITRSLDCQVTAGDSLNIYSNHMSLTRILVEGDLSSATMNPPMHYPVNNFTISTENAGSYAVHLWFNYSNDYRINVFVQAENGSLTDNNSTYYVSSGPFELDVNVTFNPRLNIIPAALPVVSPWEGFLNWTQKFGMAFPAWVKMVYLVFGLQFFAVGGLWIRRESSRRDARYHLDRSTRIFLWVDVTYKFLLAAFLAIVAVMAGEVVLLFILRFMFLVTLNLLSLWDIFVAGFAASVMAIAYLLRFTLERAFDCKPLEGE